MSDPEHKQKIWNLIKSIQTGMLTTLHEGELRARPMHLVQSEYNGTLWFFTDLESEKVFELQKDSDLCVTFAEPKSDTYVSLTGSGRVTDDQALIDKFWNPFVAAWFPDGKDSPRVGLLEIKITKGEFWDTDSSKMVQLLKIAKANLKQGETPDMGSHEKFGTS